MEEFRNWKKIGDHTGGGLFFKNELVARFSRGDQTWEIEVPPEAFPIPWERWDYSHKMERSELDCYHSGFPILGPDFFKEKYPYNWRGIERALEERALESAGMKR